MVTFSTYSQAEVPQLTTIWNDILADGLEFARETPFSESEFSVFLAKQTAVTCIYLDGSLVGFYILHPNDEGRRAHIANASFAMDKAFRGKGLGKQLVAHCLEEAREKRFKGIQFNAVVADNYSAIHIYQSLGFQLIGSVPDGFRSKDGSFHDLLIMYHVL